MVLKPKKPALWTLLFLGLPILYLAAQFLPYYYAGGGAAVSLGSYFWNPAIYPETTAINAMFFADFRSNDLVAPLLTIQIAALFIIVLTPILKGRAVLPVLLGIWGVYGLISFLAARTLTFSPVLVYGGFAGIILLVIFAAAIAVSAAYLYIMHQNYRRITAILREAD